MYELFLVSDLKFQVQIKVEKKEQKECFDSWYVLHFSFDFSFAPMHR